MRRYYYVLCLLACFLPVPASAAVRITEVAWMGVQGEGGQYGEWIELYNDADTEVDVSGWKLAADTETLFTLATSIPAGGYLLVERTTASMTDPVPGVSGESGSFGGGGIANTGEDMGLYDASGAAVDMLRFSGGWPAGDAQTKETMQYLNGTWVTAAPSPGEATTATSTDPEETDDEDDDSSQEVSTSASKSAEPKAPAPKTPAPTEPHIELVVPKQLYQYVEESFTANVVLAKGFRPSEGKLVWNMGDGTIRTTQSITPITYSYSYEGTYTVWVEYYRSPSDTAPTLSASTSVAVMAPKLSIAVADDGKAVTITNASSLPIDLSGWRVVASGQYAALPARTMLGPKASITISAATMGFPSSISGGATLTRPTGERMLSGALTVSPAQSALKAQAMPAANRNISIIPSDEEQNVVSALAVPAPLTASAQDIFAPADTMDSGETEQKSRTGTMVVLGAALAAVALLFTFFHRAMAKQG